LLRQIKAIEAQIWHASKMETLVFRCSQTGSDVQVGVVGPLVSDDTDLYEAVACPACGRLHRVNKGTGKMLGDKGGATCLMLPRN
ncbi:MAG: hypothetical protein E7A86_07225, partial [Bradyrhizobium sp.]|nr:hypothetical protein [Bradyrhizobium sp.]